MQATTLDQSRLKPGAVVRVTVDTHILRQYELPSRLWCGEIKETETWKHQHVQSGRVPAYKVDTVKAVKIDATPVLAEGNTCAKCGVHLETHTSKLFGYCLSCGGRFCIPSWSYFSDETLSQLRASLGEPFRRRDFWVQLDKIDLEILEDAPTTQPDAVDWDVRFVIERNTTIVVTCPDVAKYAPVVRSVPGYRWDSRYNVWRFNATPQIALNLKMAFEGARRRGTKEFVTLINKAEGQGRAQSLKIRMDLPPIPGLKGNGGYQHQRQGFYFLFKILTGEDLTESVDVQSTNESR